jgi:hypothetical protein
MNKIIAESYEEFLNEGLVFKKLSDKELKDLKQGELENFKISNVSAYFFTNKNNWHYAIYLNTENQILIWGNPNKGQGEDFRIIKGGKKEASEEVNKIK